MIHNLTLVLMAALAVAAAEPAFRPVPVAAPPQGPALAYVSAPLVVGAQRGALAAPAQYVAVEPSAPAPAPRTLVAYTAATPASAQYFARTYNGLTTLTLAQRPDAPVAAPLVVAPAEPAPARYVYTEPASAPARYVYAEPASAPARVVYAKPSAQPVLYATPTAASSQPARVLALTAPGAPESARLLAFTTPVAAPEPARVLAVTAQQAPVAAQVAVAPSSSSSQFFSRNYNGVPTVTYFVVGPSPVTAPVALAPQDAGARPSRRPAPGAVPAGEPVNQGDVEVLDA